jgi:hypothetical protein
MAFGIRIMLSLLLLLLSIYLFLEQYILYLVYLNAAHALCDRPCLY